MGRISSGSYDPLTWSPPTYTVVDGKVVGGYHPTGPHNWGARDTRGTLNLITPRNLWRVPQRSSARYLAVGGGRCAFGARLRRRRGEHARHSSEAGKTDLGLPLGELWWMEELADDCAADGR